MATARVVNTTAMRATKKARGSRATRVRAMRLIMEHPQGRRETIDTTIN